MTTETLTNFTTTKPERADRALTIHGSWYRHGSDWVVVLTGQPQDAVQIGIGPTVADAWASLEDTPIQSTGGEAAALRWAANQGWIERGNECDCEDGYIDCHDHYAICEDCSGTGYRLAIEPADEAAAASVIGPVGDVSWSGDTHPYVACVYGDAGDEPGDCYTRHGEDDVGLWWIDDGDDSVRQDEAGPYDTEEEAIAAAEALASDRHAGEEGEDAETMAARLLEERAGQPDPEGEWCVYWSTVLDDSHVEHRYRTRDAAEAAAQLADDGLRARNPGGNLRCGYEVRHLKGGQWVEVES